MLLLIVILGLLWQVSDGVPTSSLPSSNNATDYHTGISWVDVIIHDYMTNAIFIIIAGCWIIFEHIMNLSERCAIARVFMSLSILVLLISMMFLCITVMLAYARDMTPLYTLVIAVVLFVALVLLLCWYLFTSIMLYRRSGAGFIMCMAPNVSRLIVMLFNDHLYYLAISDMGPLVAVAIEGGVVSIDGHILARVTTKVVPTELSIVSYSSVATYQLMTTDPVSHYDNAGGVMRRKVDNVEQFMRFGNTIVALYKFVTIKHGASITSPASTSKWNM